MAKFCTIAVALFCFFTLSIAGTPPEIDEATTQVSLPLSEAANPALRLPSEPVNTETDSNSAVVSSVPLTKITFRPVNRRFHVRSKQPCRHHFRFYPKMRENEEVPYGNDMLVSTGENSDFQEPVLHGEGRRIPGRWVRLHHHHHDDEDSDSDDEDDDDEDEEPVLHGEGRRIPGRWVRLHHHHHDDEDSDSDDEDEDRLKKIVFKRYDYDRFDREKKLKKLRKHFRNEEEEKQKKGGFMKRVRKFLDHYF